MGKIWYDGAKNEGVYMNETRIEKQKNFIIRVVFIAVLLALAYLMLEYAITWVMPFLIGFLVALMFQPLIRLLHEKGKINKRLGAFLVVIVGYSLLGMLVWRLGSVLVGSLKDFSMNLPTFFSTEVVPFFNAAGQGIMGFSEWVFPGMGNQVGQLIGSFLESLQGSLGEVSTNALSSVAEISARLPFWLISFIFTILSSLFISMDYDHVMEFIGRQIPEKKKEVLLDIKDYLKKTLKGYIKAYFILMLITFAEISVGLLTLRVKNPFGIAAIIAIADVFPILGTGTVVIPWAVFSLFQQRYYLALGLILLYLIVTAVRHFVEPKVVGDQLGIPPIVAIICIYLGYIWFGVLGIIIFPITMNILLSLQKAGKIHLWK